MATALPYQVNVQDYGAVPDSVTDCAEAFQKAVDALDAHPFLGGGTVLVPAAPNIRNDDGSETVGTYLLSRSVIVDKNRVRIVGEDPLRSVVETTSYAPAFTFGLWRGTTRQTISPDHWVDLHDILDDSAVPATGQRWGYRTTVAAEGDRAAERYTVTFPVSPLAYGPPDGTYWGSVRQFTLDFVVKNNAGPWKENQQLFGLVDDNGDGAPWYAQVRPDYRSGSLVVAFCFRTTDGLRREIRVPIADPTTPVLRCSLQFDLDSGAVAAWIDNVRVAVDLTLINDGWPSAAGGPTPTFVANWYSPFNLGSLTPSSVGMVPAGGLQYDNAVDLTFAALRLSNVLRYADSGVGSAQRTTAGAVVTDADWVNGSAGEFARLPVNQNARPNEAGIPDFQVPWEALQGGNGFGVFVATDLTDADTIGDNGIEKLTINCGRRFASPDRTNNGQAVAVGQVYNFSITDSLLQYGAQGFGSYNFGVSYPVDIHHCQFNHQTDAGIYSNRQMVSGSSLSFNAWGRSALKARQANLAIRDVFCSGTQACVSAVRLYETGGAFDKWVLDFEGEQVPDGFFWATVANYVGGPTQLAIRDCQAGTAAPRAAAVRLVSSDQAGGLANSGRLAGWLTIERSFNQFAPADMQATVAVDGPMWQGVYTGLPGGPPLVVNTAEPGASARIGVGTVPPAVTVPMPPGGDPIPGLPGLIGYYRVDKMARADGTTTTLDDLSPAHNHGAAVQNLPVYQAHAVNGLPALQFVGGYYRLPASPSTTGEGTAFLVMRGAPLQSTGTMAAAGNQWSVGTTLANVVGALTPSSDTDWVVYAARYSKASGRILTTWVNGHRYDSRRLDVAPDVAFNAPTIGTIDGGKTTFTGQFSAAVLCAAALSDDQVDAVNRYLLHLHQIPV